MYLYNIYIYLYIYINMLEICLINSLFCLLAYNFFCENKKKYAK